MQELPSSAYRLAGKIVVDSDSALHEAGDVIRSVAAGLIEASNVIHIAEIIAGRRTIDTIGTTAYKTVAMALYDLCVAQALYRAARTNQPGREIRL